MSCVDDALLQMYVEGVLDAADEEILRAHLARCPRCRQHVAAYKELMWDLEHLPEPAVPKELDQLHETLLRAWNEQRRESSRSRRARGLIPAWAGTAWPGRGTPCPWTWWEASFPGPASRSWRPGCRWPGGS